MNAAIFTLILSLTIFMVVAIPAKITHYKVAHWGRRTGHTDVTYTFFCVIAGVLTGCGILIFFSLFEIIKFLW